MGQAHINRILGNISMYMIILFAVVLSLAPMIWLFGLSVSPSGSFANVTISSFLRPTFENYSDVFANTSFKIFIVNSILVAAGAIILSLTTACLSAYALVRLRFRGKSLFLGVILLLEMAPAVVLVIPYFVLFYSLGLVGSHLGLVLVHTALILPFGVWMLRSFFSKISAELMDAAQVDGCSLFGVLWRITLPLALPGILSTALLAFAISWNEFLYAFILSDRTSRTVPVAVQGLITDKAILWGRVASTGTLILIPVLLTIFVTQRYLIAGLTRKVVSE